ncbi:hypothetical protein WR25_04165 isoform A [Diploscapter pachys]|uniref:Adenosine 5'-monophosphoramidase HINT3 n=1 Tax=Diploscapter pachys TaxID=2018661 RepID=A0A2A2J4A4_9BILA|nr:hypothetical protein WR25_04165 isoform A [Diploscapter pachys]
MSIISTTVTGCKFCEIVHHKKDPVLKENEQCAVVKDIKPKAKHHYLVISKKHISKPTDLTAGDISLVEEMERLGRDVLRTELKKNGEADIVEDMLMTGFHMPPLITIKHLHMHVIYPKSDMGMLSKYVTFKPGKVFKETTELTASIRDKAGLPPNPFEAKLEASDNPCKNDEHEELPAHAITN